MLISNLFNGMTRIYSLKKQVQERKGKSVQKYFTRVKGWI